MPTLRIRRTLAAILIVLAAAGCESGFVQDAARASLSSFIVDIVDTAVTEPIGP